MLLFQLYLFTMSILNVSRYIYLPSADSLVFFSLNYFFFNTYLFIIYYKCNNMYTWNMYICNMYTCNMYICNMYICNMYICNMYICNMYIDNTFTTICYQNIQNSYFASRLSVQISPRFPLNQILMGFDLSNPVS
jgi:hypothetical protein